MHAQVRIKTMQRQRGGMDEVRAAVRRDVLSMQHTPAWSCVKDRKAKAEREDRPEILQQRAGYSTRQLGHVTAVTEQWRSGIPTAALFPV